MSFSSYPSSRKPTIERDQAQATEFLGDSRCEACVEHDHKCWIREDLDGCLVCSAGNTHCVFNRFVSRKACNFSWAELTEGTDSNRLGRAEK